MEDKLRKDVGEGREPLSKEATEAKQSVVKTAISSTRRPVRGADCVDTRYH